MKIIQAAVIVWIAAFVYLNPLVCQPKLNLVGGKRVDFGDIYTISTRKILTLKNVGDDTLIITEVSGSCGCTGTLMTNDHLAPGDSGHLAITFNAKNYNGEIEKAVSFVTNDTTQKYNTITFVGNVIKSFQLEPEYLFFSTTVDSITTKSLTLKNIYSQTIKILSAKTSSSDISIKLSGDKVEPGEELTITAIILLKKAGTASGNIDITTDFVHSPFLSIRYVALAMRKKAPDISK